MKKVSATLALLLFLALHVFSQDVTNTPYLGLKAAANFSTNSFQSPSLTDYDVKYNTGFAGGLFYNIPIANRVSLQPQLLYSQMGSKLESKLDAGNNATLKIGYVSVPLLVKFSPVNHFAIFAGPEIMFMTTAKLNYKSASDVTVTDALEHVDPAATLGVEYWFTKNFGIYACYIFGLSNINEQNPGLYLNQQIITSKIANSALQVGITIGFPEGEPEQKVPEAVPQPKAETDSDGDGITDKNDLCPDVPGSANNRGCPEMTIYFKNGEATLDSSDMAELDRVATLMNNHPQLKIMLEGHASTIGKANFNDKLSEKRAQAAHDYLVSKGISSNRMQVKGHGENFAVVGDESEDAHSQNRRVEIKVVK